MAYLNESLPLTQHEFALLCDLIEERLGLHYDADKCLLVQDRLAPLVAERRLDSFLDYYYLLKYDACSQQEWLNVQTALAVRETYFWREFEQILAAAHQVTPQLQEMRPGRRVRIWHAACASGEEPYTMAMALQQAGCFDRGPIEIIATDFDQEALMLARDGVYRERSFRALPGELRRAYFTPEEHGMRLAEDIRARVSFVYLNLADPAAMAEMRDFDMIFCRNVFIYFREAMIQQVAEKFYRALRAPGYLFLGAAESLLRIPTQFQLTEIAKSFVYVKPTIE